MDNENNIRRKFAEWVEWLVDKHDPNNFLIIPEFGVMPKSVDWEGFALPLLHPDTEDRAVAHSLRLALIAARMNVMKRFNTLAEVKRFADDAINMPHPSRNARHHDANNYVLIESIIIRAADERRSDKQRLKDISTLLALVSGFQTIEEYTLPKKLAKKRASNGGKKSAARRGKAPIDADTVVAAARKLGWPDKTYMVTKTLSRQFDRSTSYINRTLSAARSNSI